MVRVWRGEGRDEREFSSSRVVILVYSRHTD